MSGKIRIADCHPGYFIQEQNSGFVSGWQKTREKLKCLGPAIQGYPRRPGLFSQAFPKGGKLILTSHIFPGRQSFKLEEVICSACAMPHERALADPSPPLADGQRRTLFFQEPREYLRFLLSSEIAVHVDILLKK
jgi:hypothetical protein